MEHSNGCLNATPARFTALTGDTRKTWQWIALHFASVQVGSRNVRCQKRRLQSEVRVSQK